MDNNFTFIPINEISIDNISKSTLDKIKYLTDNNFNLNDFYIDTNNEVFLNIFTNEIFDIKENRLEKINNKNFKIKEKQILSKNNIKVRTLIKPKNNNSKAFIKSSLLIIIVLSLSITLAVILLMFI